MYIKQVIIHGFKSYRDRTEVDPFDPGHNVVVGRNGSGKSNFFSAIQFVISDEYTHLRQEQKQLLMHEGLGPRIVFAYVELIFDNTDGRLPIDKNEVRLRRMIGSKKDTYFLNGTTVSRPDVINLFESAGFSRSNPYYIVKQGEINQMATATDTERLRLLREVAGTRVYDERSEEARLTLKESQVKLEKAAEFLTSIEERLQTLNAEKEELKEHQRWDKQRRCLEYTIYQRELKESKQKLLDLEESSVSSLVKQKELTKLTHNAEERISATTERWTAAMDEVTMAREEQNVQSDELQQLIRKSTKLSLTIRDLREEIKSNEEDKTNAEAELEVLQQQIDEKVKELEAINPEYEKLLKEEEELTRTLMIKEQQRRELYAKQGRGIQFNSKEARDEWIQQQLAQLAKQIEDKKAYCKEIQENLATEREKHKTLENKINVLRVEIGEQKKSIEKHEEERYKEIEVKEQAQTLLKELYRQERTLETELASEKENLVQAQQKFRFMSGKQTVDGNESVVKVLNTFRDSPGMSAQVDCYCGQVIDKLSCDRGIYTAVEVTAGKKLFHHIVKNDQFCIKFFNEMNRQKLSGEVNFMPLNRLRFSTPQYPESDDAVPMISKLEFDKKYDKAMRQIFGRTLICRNLEIAGKFARERGLDCVTIDGDVVSSKGSITGGYRNRERTILGDYQTRTTIAANVAELENKLATLKAETRKVTQTVCSQVSKIQKLDVLIRKAKDTYEEMETDIRAIKQKLSVIERDRIPKERSLAQCTSDLDEMYATREGWEQELNQDLTSKLTPSEQKLLDTLNEDIRTLTKESKTVFERRVKSETIKTKLDNLLTNNLMRRKDELTEMLQKASGHEKQRQLESYLTKLAKIRERKELLENETKTLSDKLTSAIQALQAESEELERWKMVKKDVQEKLEESAKTLEKFTSKKNVYDRKIAEVVGKIAGLGTLPRPETYNKFSDMTNKDLFRELEKTNKELKRYSHVNKKALDQYVSFSDQREKLVNRKEELDRGNEKIQELMAALEQKKYEAIQFTFKQVSKYFSEVFKKLVPSGHANVVIKRSIGGNDEEEDSGAADTDNFVGVGISVSFSGQSAESSEMNQLSGGQKSLVALALIFAIQKCDPAPFYLFDEIDQALDAQHREAVAAMIHEQSSNAQFITTTFKPEMLRQANKCYGVKYSSKVSNIICVTKEEAADFLESDPNDTQ